MINFAIADTSSILLLKLPAVLATRATHKCRSSY